MKKKRSQRFYDYSLLFTIAFLIMFGLLMIYSASSYKAQLDYNGNAAYFMTRQGVIALGGFAFMILISRLDYRWYAKFYKLAIAVSWYLSWDAGSMVRDDGLELVPSAFSRRSWLRSRSLFLLLHFW